MTWREIAEQQAEALADALAQLAALQVEADELRQQVDESAEVLDRWARESCAAAERARRAEGGLRIESSLRRGLVG